MEKTKLYLEIAGTLLQNHYDQQELRKKAMNRLRNIVLYWNDKTNQITEFSL